MKKLLLTTAFFCFFVLAYSQSDTLFTKKHEKIPCKIIEINDSDDDDKKLSKNIIVNFLK